MDDQGNKGIGKSVQENKDILADKKTVAEAETPQAMELVGWAVDGWLSPFPLFDENARPVYAFIKNKVETEEETQDSIGDFERDQIDTIKETNDGNTEESNTV